MDAGKERVMPYELSFAFSTGIAVAMPAAHEVRVQYSAITSTETRLPEGIRPVSLLANRTGLLLVGDLVSGHRSEAERVVEGSMQYVRRVAAALPINADDERIVDALIAKRFESLSTKRLRRREGDPR
jgi:hypothetical protein